MSVVYVYRLRSRRYEGGCQKYYAALGIRLTNLPGSIFIGKPMENSHCQQTHNLADTRSGSH